MGQGTVPCPTFSPISSGTGDGPLSHYLLVQKQPIRPIFDVIIIEKQASIKSLIPKTPRGQALGVQCFGFSCAGSGGTGNRPLSHFTMRQPTAGQAFSAAPPEAFPAHPQSLPRARGRWPRRGRMRSPSCHCEPVLTLVWQSVYSVPRRGCPFLLLVQKKGTKENDTREGKISFSPPPWTLPHSNDQTGLASPFWNSPGFPGKR